MSGERPFGSQVKHDPQRLRIAPTPDADDMHGALTHVTQYMVGGLFGEADGERDLAPSRGAERRRITAPIAGG